VDVFFLKHGVEHVMIDGKQVYKYT